MEISLNTILGIVTLLGVGFTIIKGYFFDNKKQDENIKELQTSCNYKHQGIDKDINEIKESVKFIKENHLTHIEERMGKVENKMIEIHTILKERLPNK